MAKGKKSARCETSRWLGGKGRRQQQGDQGDPHAGAGH